MNLRDPEIPDTPQGLPIYRAEADDKDVIGPVLLCSDLVKVVLKKKVKFIEMLKKRTFFGFDIKVWKTH